MLSRGHLIGQIIDDLAGIASQAKVRGRLHLFDIHIHIENFAKEVLNRVLQLSLSNLNLERSNNPGLDLGDATKGWAFQVTADKSSAKIKATLEQVDGDQRAKYPNIRILVIGEKQGSYTFDGEPYESAGFKPEMVWDFDDVCSHIMSLSLDEIIDLAKYVSGETRRVKIELEIPDEEGRYQTNIDDLIESLPHPHLSDAAKMAAHFEAKYGERMDREWLEAAIAELSRRLASLPRLTREIFKLLVERRDKPLPTDSEDFAISESKLRRIYSGEDLNGDLGLLSEGGLIGYNERGFHRDVDYWSICIPGKDSFDLFFLEYITDLRLDLRKPLVSLDFSDF